MKWDGSKNRQNRQKSRFSGVYPNPPWGTRKMYHSFKQVYGSVRQTSNSFINFVLLELAVPQNVRRFRPGLPWAVMNSL